MANNQYLTFIALEDCEFSLRVWSGYPHMVRYYSVDNGNSWVRLSSSSEKAPLVTTPTITSGNTILWRGETNSGYAGEFGIFSSTGRFIAEGNALSIDNYLNFSGCTNLVSAENLTFSSGTFKGYTFADCTSLVTPPPSVPDGGKGVFSGCTSMTSLPTIQNTTLSFQCFMYMFKGCSSLTTIPSNYLPSQIMAMACYYGMFQDCTSLVNVPNDLLPATTLASSCYAWMFSGCTSLKIPPKLLATKRSIISDTEEYREMFKGCTSLEQIPEFPKCSVDFDQYTYTSMFENCTSLKHVTYPPHIPIGQCMFTGCTSLSAVTCISTSGRGNYQWLKNVSNSGIFYKDKNASWGIGEGGIPSGWEVADFGSGIYKKYHVAKEQYRLETGGTWTDTDPLVTEISGDPIARYATLSECEAVTATTRWIESGTTCIDGNKYQNNYKQVSDDGVTWRDSNPLEWSASTLIESASTDCIFYRWTQSGTTCIGYDKYQNNIKEISVDGGVSWNAVIPEEYSASTLVQERSEDCGFVPTYKVYLEYYGLNSYTVRCNSSTTITKNEVRTTVSNRNYTKISGVTIGNCATSIGNDAFDYCVSLKQLVIPSNITSIGEWFINDCTGLTYIIFEGTVPPTAAYGAFETEYSINCPIYVPCESLETYKNAPEYRKVANRIQCIPPKYTIGLNGGVTSSGNCNGNDTIYGQSYEYNNPQDVLSLETGLCVKNIFDSAFKNCNNMTALTLSETVENIGENAFENINVNYLKIPRCVKTIHSKAFNNSNIQTIKCFATVPPTLYEDDGDVFNYSNIQTVYVYIAMVDRYKAAAGWSKFGGKIVGMTNTN